MILTVANLKGGTSKTTSAAFLAHALAERGRRVLVVDADPQASITRWAEMAEWRLPVVGKATGRLHVELEEIVGDRFDTSMCCQVASSWCSGLGRAGGRCSA